MFKIKNENHKLVNIEDLCNLELNCCYIDWKGIIYFCANSDRIGNELIVNGEDGEEVISIRSQTNLFVLSESKDEDDIEVYKIMEVVE